MERRKIWLVGALAFALLASEFVPDEGGGSRLTAGQAVSADEPVASPTPGSFFVSPQGNNSWSGRLAAPGDNDGPFATIVWAREAVRALLKTQEQPRLVPILMAAGAAKVQGASDSQSDSLKEKSMLLGTESKRTFASGPLWVGKRNPRYFEDVQGRIVYLTGSHTWSNLQDIGPTDPSPAFNFDAHLDFLKKHHHNFIRLWRWELPKWTERDKRIRYCAPHSWKRTGPGEAFDGKPKFDLHQLDPAYFDRLRSRVVAAGKQGIYVSIMLFEGWGLSFASWDGHPFNVHNNLQGINGDPNGDGKGTETHTLTIPAVTEFQEAYVRKVIDTVNDLDNVLFEVANESNFDHSKDWQYHIVHYVKDYEKKKPKQHPVGITGFTRSDNKIMTDSPADWVSLGGTGYTHEEGPFKSDPPTADGKKVSLLDTDHIWGVGGGREWVWKSFLRGHNPIWMDPYDDSSAWEPLPPNAEDVRRNLGDARRYAERIDLAVMTPSSQLASTKYCLANAGSEYLVYLPDGGSVTVDLTNAQGDFAVEWQNAATGKDVKANTVPGGARREFNAPFDGDAVLYLVRATRK